MRRRRQERRDSTVSARGATLLGGGLAAAATVLSGSVSDAAGTRSHVTVTSLGDTSSPKAKDVHNGHAPTLADAIAYLDTKAGGGKITFASKLSGRIHLHSPLPPITRPIDVHGPGANRLKLTGSARKVPVFKVEAGKHTVTEFSGLTISGGRDGAIDARSPVIVKAATITHNHRRLGGGGIVSFSRLTVEQSKITHNRVTKSPYSGGGIVIYGNGKLIVRESTISGNTAPFGGGVATYGSGKTIIDRSTISGNVATENVGGIDLEGSDPHRGPRGFIENSTIANNVAHGSIGGLYLGDKRRGGKTMLTIVGATISGNRARNGSGGGILDTYGTIKLDDSIVAGNRDTVTGGGASPDLGIFGKGTGHQVIARFSLIGDGKETIMHSLVTNRTDLVGTRKRHVNARLKPLRHNGGPTLTMAPAKGSPALNRGNAKSFRHAIRGLVFKSDQRGHRRAGHGGSSKTTDHTDIGAVEVGHG